MGGIFSTVALMIACEPLASFALKFGSAEYFWLAIFGLSMMISISHVALAKGLVVGALGLLLLSLIHIYGRLFKGRRSKGRGGLSDSRRRCRRNQDEKDSRIFSRRQ